MQNVSDQKEESGQTTICSYLFQINLSKYMIHKSEDQNYIGREEHLVVSYIPTLLFLWPTLLFLWPTLLKCIHILLIWFPILLFLIYKIWVILCFTDSSRLNSMDRNWPPDTSSEYSHQMPNEFSTTPSTQFLLDTHVSEHINNLLTVGVTMWSSNSMIIIKSSPYLDKHCSSQYLFFYLDLFLILFLILFVKLKKT